MKKDLSKCLEIYQQQLVQGDIRYAYVTLMKYMGELKARFPKTYTTGNISCGYLDYTYFPFSNDFLKQHKLRFGIVLNHEKMQFELWLLGQNASIQKTYWEVFKNTSWNKDIQEMPQYAILEVCLEKHIDFKHKDEMTSHIYQKAVITAKEIQQFLSTLSKV